MPLSKVLKYALVAAVANGVCQSQSGTAGTALTLNGSLVSSSVATLDSNGASRRVIITSAGNDSGITFAVTGTDRYGAKFTENVTGVNTAAAQSNNDFKTVTSVVPSGNTASTVTVGTNSVGSSEPWVLDAWVAGQMARFAVNAPSGTAYNIEGAVDDLSPQWNLTTATPYWNTVIDGTAAGLTDQLVTGPYTMLRLTITSGTGTVVAKALQTYAGLAA